MQKTEPRAGIGVALREVRRSLGLLQEQLAQRLRVSRETISAWETGRWPPLHDERVRMVQRLADAPADALARLAAALGVPAPAPREAAPDPAARTRFANALRAAADELDVPASVLRRTLGVLVTHLKAGGVPLESLAGLVASEPRAAKR